MLNPTSPDRLTDRQGHPYFLWDSEMTLDEFRRGLQDPNPEVRAYLVGKLMRQAKPDDVFTFISTVEIRALWPRLERYLGQAREFWTWLLDAWPGPSAASSRSPWRRPLDGPSRRPMISVGSRRN